MNIIPKKIVGTVQSFNSVQHVGQVVFFDKNVKINALVVSRPQEGYNAYISPRIWDANGNLISTSTAPNINLNLPGSDLLILSLGEEINLSANTDYIIGFKTNFGATSYGFHLTTASVKSVVGGVGITPRGVLKRTSNVEIAPNELLGTRALAIGVVVPANGKIKDLVQGEQINFAGSPWTVLDPTTGYLFKNESIGNRMFDSKYKNIFDPNDPDNVGYYLNTTYFNSFTATEKSAIQTKNWGIGSLTSEQAGSSDRTPAFSPTELKNKEDSVNITTNVGLLSASEWRRYSRYPTHAGDSGVLTIPLPSYTWLRTPTTDSSSTPWCIHSDGSLISGFGSKDYTFLVRPAIYVDLNLNVVNGTVVHNAVPTLTLNTTSNATLYENDTFLIDGTAKDTDAGNVVNVYYQIGVGAVRAIKTDISDGVTAIAFSRQLTFKAGMLHYNDLAVTGALSEGSAHTLKVWSEDNQGGKSTIAERTFYVVPNRAPALTVDPFTDQSDMINNDKITLSGTSSDPDGNDVTVKYRVNEEMGVQIHSGVAGPWTFDLSLKGLKVGENTIVLEVTDTYNFKSSRTIKLNKHANLTPLASSTQRYTIVPPSGSAQGVLLWIQRDATQTVTAEISMTTGTEQEQFVPLPLENSAPVGEDVEDYFKYRADAPAEHISLKFSWTGDKPITLISGALLQ